MTVPAPADPEPPSRSLDIDYHAARVLLLVAAFSGEQHSGIDSLTKLAKLDFLLRYPALLEQLAAVLSTWMPDYVRPTPQEKLAVESRMIRYKYGPWDERYYPVIGLLLGTGLVQSAPGKGKISLSPTEKGAEVARQISEGPSWEMVVWRCEYLAEFFDISGSQLKELIYEHLPEVVDRPHRSII